MGVNTFILDRRTVRLLIGSTVESAGTLRRFFKVTELDDDRARELVATKARQPSPEAVILADVSELALAGAPDSPVTAHLVLGWDKDRRSVTDFGWDYLPKLGYAVQDRASGEYVLHEERSGLLHPIDGARAREIGLLDSVGRLSRHGQPRVAACRSVKLQGLDYAEADCLLDNGIDEKLLTAIANQELPPADWYLGKRPMDVERYPPTDIGPVL